jgi:hypothetical protein
MVCDSSENQRIARANLNPSTLINMFWDPLTSNTTSLCKNMWGYTYGGVANVLEP